MVSSPSKSSQSGGRSLPASSSDADAELDDDELTELGDDGLEETDIERLEGSGDKLDGE